MALGGMDELDALFRVLDEMFVFVTVFGQALRDAQEWLVDLANVHGRGRSEVLQVVSQILELVMQVL